MQASLKKQTYESLDEKTQQRISTEQGFSFAFLDGKVVGIQPLASARAAEVAVEEERGR